LEALSLDCAARPSLDEFQARLWEALSRLDADTHDGLRIQMDWMTELSSRDTEWPHMDERLLQLQQFYSAV
jgi:hypothetical protein